MFNTNAEFHPNPPLLWTFLTVAIPQTSFSLTLPQPPSASTWPARRWSRRCSRRWTSSPPCLPGGLDEKLGKFQRFFTIIIISEFVFLILIETIFFIYPLNHFLCLLVYRLQSFHFLFWLRNSLRFRHVPGLDGQREQAVPGLLGKQSWEFIKEKK